MNVAALFQNIGFTGACVMGCLVALSIYSVSVTLDKYRRFRAAARQTEAFLPKLGTCLREGKLQDAVTTAHQHQNSHVARVVSAGIGGFIGRRSSDANATDAVELAARAADRSAARTLAELKKGLGGLATIASTAPFIGLFGTVVGIIHAFEGIAATGSGGVGVVSGGIAEALVATALGILVAIPAVMAFNYFTGALERFESEMQDISEELVDLLRRARPVHARG
jgi:biopolymer transport protein ExbB/biopolymer transport protein TolQ